MQENSFKAALARAYGESLCVRGDPITVDALEIRKVVLKSVDVEGSLNSSDSVLGKVFKTMTKTANQNQDRRACCHLQCDFRLSVCQRIWKAAKL